MLSIFAAALLSHSPGVQQSSREDRGGWIILHLAGSPHDVGYQQGSLVAEEIADSISAVNLIVKEDGKNWSWLRTTAHRLFWDKLDPEYRDEISGIAEGATSKGVHEDPDDILALNSYIELTDYYLPYEESHGQKSLMVSHAPLACSAFVATGSTTKDHKVVMGHNFWWDYLTGERFRVVLDIHPAKGHHIVFDAMPGFIESGTDWAINDAQIGFCETTISGFVGFDPGGVPEFERMRKAIQYGSTLDEVARIFKAGNNGGYANTWLMVDGKTNEIGKLQLGLKNVVFSTSNDGFYCGSNFPEDPKLIKEETPGYYPGGNEEREKRWISHLTKDRGNVDQTLAEGYLADTFDSVTGKFDGRGGGALCSKGGGSGAINANVLTADSLAQMEFWGRMGCPDGSNLELSRRSANAAQTILHDLPGEPWTLVQGSR
jgi:hypothetical protein